MKKRQTGERLYWLVKSEPDVWSWDQHYAKGIEPWSGVRNYQANANMKAMMKGDLAFFYHSNKGREIIGVLEVFSEHSPDPTDDTGRFGMVLFKAKIPLQRPVTLGEIKSCPSLQHMVLLRQPRLSVSPVTQEEWKTIFTLADSPPKDNKR